jgi:hypothetical protein
MADVFGAEASDQTDQRSQCPKAGGYIGGHIEPKNIVRPSCLGEMFASSYDLRCSVRISRTTPFKRRFTALVLLQPCIAHAELRTLKRISPLNG